MIELTTCIYKKYFWTVISLRFPGSLENILNFYFFFSIFIPSTNQSCWVAMAAKKAYEFRGIFIICIRLHCAQYFFFGLVKQTDDFVVLLREKIVYFPCKITDILKYKMEIKFINLKIHIVLWFSKFSSITVHKLLFLFKNFLRDSSVQICLSTNHP